MGYNIRTLVSNIQHFCVHDGNGFRTTVFLQGCPLQCRWCQNPELQAVNPVHMYNVNACVNCLNCVEACHKENLRPEKNGFRPIDSKSCYDCSKLKIAPCTKACAYGARNLSSSRMSLEDVAAECWKECAFWVDGGGITLSGGEPLLQLDFCYKFSRLCQERETNLAVETCGYLPWESFEKIYKYVNTFLYDVKLVTPHLRRKWLGIEAALDLDNLRKLADLHNHIVVRVPLIPGVNDTEREFSAILNIITNLPQVCNLQILPFHQFGSSKYTISGMEYTLTKMQVDNEESIKRCCHMAEIAGLNVDVGGMAFTKAGEEKNCGKNL